MHALFRCKSLYNIILVLIDSPDQVISNADVQRSVTFTCHYIYVVSIQCFFSGFWLSPE
jgi:hypothetical protein